MRPSARSTTRVATIIFALISSLVLLPKLSLTRQAYASGLCAPDASGHYQGIETAIGCIEVTSSHSLTGTLFNIFTLTGGGIAFALILFGGLQVLTSSGNPKRVQAGKELITSALTGMLLIIFATFVYRFIAGDFLELPDFGP